MRTKGRRWELVPADGGFDLRTQAGPMRARALLAASSVRMGVAALLLGVPAVLSVAVSPNVGCVALFPAILVTLAVVLMDEQQQDRWRVDVTVRGGSIAWDGRAVAMSDVMAVDVHERQVTLMLRDGSLRTAELSDPAAAAALGTALRAHREAFGSADDVPAGLRPLAGWDRER